MFQMLDGMRVIESSAFVAAPLAGMTLAQMGADVIRVDLPGGGLDYRRWPVTRDGVSLFWAGLNKGKKSIAVDMKSPEGRELVTRVITAPGEDAGMFITNLRVRGWMDHETLATHRPDRVSVTLLEAMATGLPIAATQVGGNAEVVEQGETGLLSPRGDDQTLGNNLLALLQNPQQRRSMGQRGRARLLDVFTQDRMHQQYADLYAKMLGM